jgi:hypothetical protein
MAVCGALSLYNTLSFYLSHFSRATLTDRCCDACCSQFLFFILICGTNRLFVAALEIEHCVLTVLVPLLLYLVAASSIRVVRETLSVG